MAYSPAEAWRTSSWRLRMAYSPDDFQKHHPAWHEELAKKKTEKEDPTLENFAFPHAQINEMAAD